MAPIPLMRVAIVANGEFDFQLADEVRSADLVIAADAGLAYLHQLNIRPDIIVGDFDSMPEGLLDLYPTTLIKRFQADKDLSDLELALECAWEYAPKQVYLYGAMGLRVDHQLYNLMLLGRYPKQVKIITGKEEIFAIDVREERDCIPGQTVSFIPIYGKVTGVTTRGLRWELDSADLDLSFLSLSNRTLSDRFEVEVKNGLLLCCLSKPFN